MRFTKLVSSKTSSVDPHSIFEYKHTLCSNTRKMTARYQDLVIWKKGPETRLFQFATTWQQCLGWGRNSIQFRSYWAFFINLTDENRLCDLPQHRVVPKSSRYIQHKFWNIPSMSVTRMLPHHRTFFPTFQSIQVFFPASVSISWRLPNIFVIAGFTNQLVRYTGTRGKIPFRHFGRPDNQPLHTALVWTGLTSATCS